MQLSVIFEENLPFKTFNKFVLSLWDKIYPLLIIAKSMSWLSILGPFALINIWVSPKWKIASFKCAASSLIQSSVVIISALWQKCRSRTWRILYNMHRSRLLEVRIRLIMVWLILGEIQSGKLVDSRLLFKCKDSL